MNDKFKTVPAKYLGLLSNNYYPSRIVASQSQCYQSWLLHTFSFNENKDPIKPVTLSLNGLGL